MFRNLALIGFCSVGIILAGCRGDDDAEPPVDLSRSIPIGDGGSIVDLAMNVPHMTTTAHDIDTGVVAKNVLVSVSGLVIIDPPDSFASSKGANCTFEAIVQDPACTTPPCGLYVDIVTPFSARTPGDTKHCIYVEDSTTFFKNSKVGDTIDVTGTSDAFTNTGGPTEHSIVADNVVASATKGTITATPVTINGASDTQFVYCPGDACPANSGAGWSMYEGMLLKVSEASGSFTIAQNNDSSLLASELPFYFLGNPGTVSFSASNNHLYDANDGGTTVAPGKTFSAITGAVDVHDSTIAPRFSDDFTP